MRGTPLRGRGASARRASARPSIGLGGTLVVVFCCVQIWLVVKGQPGALRANGSATAAGLLAAEARAAHSVSSGWHDAAAAAERAAERAAAAVLRTSPPRPPRPPPSPSPPSPPPLPDPPPAPTVPGAFTYVPAPPNYPPPPPFPPGERVLVATRTGHFFGEYERVVPDCDVACEFRSMQQSIPEADALWYHAPSACGQVPDRAFPDQVAIVMSMESSINYACLDDANYMKQFDIEMTYRLNCSVPLQYLREGHVEDFKQPVVPFDQKIDAVVYVQSNCQATSGRDDILRALQGLNVTLAARGACLNNGPQLPHGQSKREVIAQYKFCATMENSLTVDYVSEKMWDGLAAGCLPIYYGAPNVQEHLPSPDAVVDYRALGGTPEALAAELKRLMLDRAAYEQRFAWRSKPLSSLGQGYQRLVGMTRMEHSQCRVCKIVATLRAERRAKRAAADAAAAKAQQQEAAAAAQREQSLQQERRIGDAVRVEDLP